MATYSKEHEKEKEGGWSIPTLNQYTTLAQALHTEKDTQQIGQKELIENIRQMMQQDFAKGVSTLNRILYDTEGNVYLVQYSPHKKEIDAMPLQKSSAKEDQRIEEQVMNAYRWLSGKPLRSATGAPAPNEIAYFAINLQFEDDALVIRADQSTGTQMYARGFRATPQDKPL